MSIEKGDKVRIMAEALIKYESPIPSGTRYMGLSLVRDETGTELIGSTIRFYSRDNELIGDHYISEVLASHGFRIHMDWMPAQIQEAIGYRGNGDTKQYEIQDLKNRRVKLIEQINALQSDLDSVESDLRSVGIEI